MYKDNKKRDRGRDSRAPETGEDERINMRGIMKDIEFLGSAHMTWKEKKALENNKVVSLGGKDYVAICETPEDSISRGKEKVKAHEPQKQERRALGVAKGRMKKQKQREEQMQHERMILGCFGGKLGGDSKRSAPMKRRPEERVLKSTEGTFKNGVLNVKRLMHQTLSREFHSFSDMFSKGEKTGNGNGKGKGKGKKSKGKKGGGKKRR